MAGKFLLKASSFHDVLALIASDKKVWLHHKVSRAKVMANFVQSALARSTFNLNLCLENHVHCRQTQLFLYTYQYKFAIQFE